MAGIVGQYNQVPRFRTIVSTKPIPSDGVTNPADTTEIPLPNVRGQVAIIIETSDAPAGVSSSFSVVGGFGEFPDVYTRNWTFVNTSNVNCTVASPFKNRLEVTTTAPAIVRTYVFDFSPVQTVPATVRQTSVTTLGANDLTVKLIKLNVVEGY